MKSIAIPFLILILFIISCDPKQDPEQVFFDKALENGALVNEGYNRCKLFVDDWLEHADPTSGLIPENLSAGKDIWNGHNSAADNYPFMVLTSYLLDKELFEGKMLDMLNTEKRLTSRIGSLPDVYSFSKKDFLHEKVDTARIIFGGAEYIKDGLIPLTEYLGESPWRNRMIEMMDDLSKNIQIADNVRGDFYGNSIDTEINGDFLQSLSRIYWMTKDQKYYEWAKLIGDYYLLENPDKLLSNKRLRLRDHGCEILGGLSELYVMTHFLDPEKKATYQECLHKVFDRILEVGRNEDGMFYNEVNMETGEVVDSMIVDNWGYIYNAYYTLFLLDEKAEYRDAVLKPLTVLNQKYRNFNWETGSADGYADAIESGINLYNRENVPELAEWLDSEIKVMWGIQDSAQREGAQRWSGKGIIEGWHGDGNFARTTIMYCLWKTKDVTVQPWRNDLFIGSHQEGDTLYISLQAKEDWKGTLFFGEKRHKKMLNLPIDYPRINQFAEWFSIDENEVYLVSDDKKKPVEIKGSELLAGLKASIAKNKPYQIKVIRQTKV